MYYPSLITVRVRLNPKSNRTRIETTFSVDLQVRRRRSESQIQ